MCKKLDNLDHIDCEKKTAFMYACEYGSLDCVKILMKYNINLC